MLRNSKTSLYVCARQSGCCDAMNYRASPDVSSQQQQQQQQPAAGHWQDAADDVADEDAGPSCPIQRRRDVDSCPKLTITTCVNGERWRRRHVIETSFQKSRLAVVLSEPFLGSSYT